MEAASATTGTFFRSEWSENGGRARKAESRNGKAEMGNRLGEDLDAGAVAETFEEVFAIFPSETEGTDIGHAETRNYKAQSVRILVGKLAVEQRRFGPIHQLRQGNLVVQESGELFRSSWFRH